VLKDSLALSVLKEPSSEQLRREEMSVQEFARELWTLLSNSTHGSKFEGDVLGLDTEMDLALDA